MKIMSVVFFLALAQFGCATWQESPQYRSALAYKAEKETQKIYMDKDGLIVDQYEHPIKTIEQNQVVLSKIFDRYTEAKPKEAIDYCSPIPQRCPSIRDFELVVMQLHNEQIDLQIDHYTTRMSNSFQQSQDRTSDNATKFINLIDQTGLPAALGRYLGSQ